MFGTQKHYVPNNDLVCSEHKIIMLETRLYNVSNMISSMFDTLNMIVQNILPSIIIGLNACSEQNSFVFWKCSEQIMFQTFEILHNVPNKNVPNVKCCSLIFCSEHKMFCF